MLVDVVVVVSKRANLVRNTSMPTPGVRKNNDKTAPQLPISKDQGAVGASPDGCNAGPKGRLENRLIRSS